MLNSYDYTFTGVDVNGNKVKFTITLPIEVK